MYKRKMVICTSVIIILMLVFIPINVMAAKGKVIPNDKTGIPDKVLYQAILSELGKNTNETFSDKEVMKIKQLNASNYDKKDKIKTLKGIGKLKRLTNLDVSHNSLLSLSGIENLVNLTILHVNNNQIKDIRAIRNLLKLQSIDLDNNKITSLKDIEKLTKLIDVYAQINRIKKLPDMNKYPELKQVNFKYNRISERELDKKLSPKFSRKTIWYKSQVKLQNLYKTIKLVNPTSFKSINKNTRKISGIANKNSTISLRDPNGKKIVSDKTDSKGKFTFNNLNLKKWAGMTLSLQSYVVDQLYGEKNILKEVKFTIPN